MLLVTGATGLIGSHVAERLRSLGRPVRALVRKGAGDPDRALLEAWGVECVQGDVADGESLARALHGVTAVVHCAARVGDWGEAQEYRRINVAGTQALLDAVRRAPGVRRLVALSSLGVYEPRDHYGTDETVAPWAHGLDPYTRTKVEAELLTVEAARAGVVPAVILRPGFVYGARDRHVLPGLLASLRSGVFAYFGDGSKKLDNTYVKNVVAAVLRGLDGPDTLVGGVFNVTDARLVTRREFVGAVARGAGLPEPTRHVPLPLARAMTWAFDGAARLARLSRPPLVSKARYKFLALNLEYSIERARTVLGYDPPYGFEDGMAEAMLWFRERGAA